MVTILYSLIITGNRNVHKFWSEEQRAWINIRATWDE